MNTFPIIFLITACITSYAQGSFSNNPGSPNEWKNISSENKPWTRWWWHGSAVTKEGITTELEALKAVGIGGVEITPIYGVLGYEDKFINYLSDEWISLLIHTLKEGERLGLGIDMATGTGWPFGGPWVTDADACKNFQYKVYEVTGGSSLKDKIEFIQQPFLNAVGSQIYEVSETFSTERGTSEDKGKAPAKINAKAINIADLVQPISANKNLQALALDQVQFERPLPLTVLMGYGSKGEIINLTNKVDGNGKLHWTAPSGKWKVYALFQGWHGKMVERAGPGGEGNVIDHFSAQALKNYLDRFDSAFKEHDISTLRAFFNDSYEVDDARGTANWTSDLLDEFQKRRGYDLLQHLPALLGNDEKEKHERILCDYRETISELVLNNFTQPWKKWAHEKKALVRNQAHGSPANILDLYSTVDIPEIEGVDPLRIKMASSAANVTGKKLASAEAATWLNEHFESNLADIKVALDRFMLNGINHIVYHGTAYSPEHEPWPGWLFYAAVHLNQRNPLWQDFDVLNAYVTRCQSFLQNTSADNDVLLYYPIYDRFSMPGNQMIEHFDGVEKQFAGTSFARSAQMMLESGYAFDYISDKQIEKLIFEKGSLITEGLAHYKTIVIPHCKYIPLKTLEKLFKLSEAGATIIFIDGMPKTFSGYAAFKKDSIAFSTLNYKLSNGISTKKNLKVGSNLQHLLAETECRKESMVAEGISCLRKKDNQGASIYMLNNQKDSTFHGWLPLHTKAQTVLIYDPMTGLSGKGSIKTTDDQVVHVYVQLSSHQTLILKTTNEPVNQNPYPFYEPKGGRIHLDGKWHLRFISGGPQIPKAVEIDSLTSWTNFTGEEYRSFSGSAIYEIKFSYSKSGIEHWLLDLGSVDESAEIFLNGDSICTLVGPPYAIVIPSSLLKKDNELTIRVSNLMMNRIAFMDRKNIFWKKFYNVNFPARRPENRENGIFNASGISPRSSGLIGPLRLMAVQTIK